MAFSPFNKMGSKIFITSLLLALAFSIAFTQEAAQAQTQAPEGHQLSPAVKILTDDNFNNHVTNTTLWFVMFYAPWCPHCKHSMAPFDQYAQKFPDQINVGIVDW